MNIINVGYDSTHYYILDIKNGKLLVDCGWPGTLPKFLAVLKRKDVALSDIKYLLVTHFHPDHAGLAQDLKNLGASLILLESQEYYITAMDGLYESKNMPYLPILPEKNILLKFEDSRGFLAKIGLQGEILPTPGHSQDSVTLILDEGYAFTGDLAPQSMLPQGDKASWDSWERIYQHQIKQIFPGHGS